MEKRLLGLGNRFTYVLASSTIICIGLIYFLTKNEEQAEEISLYKEYKVVQDSALAFVSLILPENVTSFDSAAIYSRIEKKSRTSFKYNYEDTVRSGIAQYEYLRSKISFFKLLKPYYLDKIGISKLDDIYNVTLSLKTISYKDVLKCAVDKNGSWTYNNIYKDTEMSLNFKKSGRKFYFVNFAY